MKYPRYTELIYTFCNFGNYYTFKPNATNTFYSQKQRITNLEYYKDRVEHAQNRAVYILDEQGGELGVESYQTMAKRFKKRKK